MVSGHFAIINWHRCKLTLDTLDISGPVMLSHYDLYSALNNANCVKAALHQRYIKLGGFISALHYLDGGNSLSK